MPAPELHEPFTAVAFIGTNGFRVLAGQLREQGRMCLTTAQQPCIGISAAAVGTVTEAGAMEVSTGGSFLPYLGIGLRLAKSIAWPARCRRSLSIFAEAALMPYGIVCSKTNKPSVEHVVIQLFQQMSLRSQAIDGQQ